MLTAFRADLHLHTCLSPCAEELGKALVGEDGREVMN